MRKDEFPLIDAYADSKVNEVLDKIRAEIEKKYGDYDVCEWCVDYDYEDNNVSEYRLVGKVLDILAIIDRYKAESEEQQ